MQAFQMISRRAVILTIIALSILIILYNFFGDVPLEYVRNYNPAEPVPVQIPTDAPQPGYFKVQPEWNFSIPPRAKGWKGYAKKPRPKDVVVLTASDGGGHNSAIPDVLGRVLDDRKQYCEKHGYTNLWLNTSRYDIGEAHRTWSKIPAVAEAFYLNPDAEWVWLIDTDIVIMNPEYDLVDEILAPEAIKKGLMRDEPILDGMLKNNPTHINTRKDIRVEDIDILITQDHQMINTGSTFFRRTAVTRWILEIMTDYVLLMGADNSAAEQGALKHLMLEHPIVRDHVGIYPQRKFNAYVQGGPEMGYRDGDLLVHFAGCWVGGACAKWFEEFWDKKGKSEPWKPAEDRAA